MRSLESIEAGQRHGDPSGVTSGNSKGAVKDLGERKALPAPLQYHPSGHLCYGLKALVSLGGL